MDNDFFNKLINFLEQNLEENFIALYLLGSYASNNFFQASDIDVIICCAGSSENKNLQNFQNKFQEFCKNYSRRIDARFIWMAEDKEIPLEFKSAKLLYGEDVLEEIPVESIKRYITRAAQTTCTAIARIRHLSADSLNYPLSYPDAKEYFYSYIKDNSSVNSVRNFCNLNLYMARFFLGLKENRMVSSKKDLLTNYQKNLKDESFKHFSNIFDLCHERLQYCFPKSLEDKKQLRELCMGTLIFENDFLYTLYSLVQARSEKIYIEEFQ